MKYQIYQHKSLTSLEHAVNTALGYGWKPQGGICYSNSDGYIQYTQALIKED